MRHSAVVVASEHQVRDLRVAVHDSIPTGRHRRQRSSGVEHALCERLDGGEVPMRSVLDERLAQRAQMSRRVVHPETAVAEAVVEIADGAMELRDDAPGRARLLGRLERVAAHAVDARQRAPYAFVLEPECSVACRYDARRREAFVLQMLGHLRDVDVDLCGENRVHAL